MVTSLLSLPAVLVALQVYTPASVLLALGSNDRIPWAETTTPPRNQVISGGGSPVALQTRV